MSFDTPGRPGEFLSKVTLNAPDGVSFRAGTFTVVDATDGLKGKITCENPCSGDKIVLDFANGAFVKGENFDYAIGVCRQDGEACIPGSADQLLANGTYTFQFETDGLVDGMLVPFEQFQTTSDLLELDDDVADLMANSQLPDLTIPSQILNPTTFVGFYSQPCTIGPGGCPEPRLVDVTPDDIPVPEPAAGLLLASALALLCGVRRRAFRAVVH